MVVGMGKVGSTHSSENVQKTLAPRQHTSTHTDTSCDVWDLWKLEHSRPSGILWSN